MINLEKFCDSWLAAWSGNRPEELLKYYTEDVFYSDPALPKGISGMPALRGYLIKLLAKNPDWKWSRVKLYPNEEGFSLLWTAEIPVGQKTVLVSGMDRVVLKGSLISRNEVYFDPRPMLAAEVK